MSSAGIQLWERKKLKFKSLFTDNIISPWPFFLIHVNYLTFRTRDDFLRRLERAQTCAAKDMTAQQHVREIPHSFIF